MKANNTGRPVIAGRSSPATFALAALLLAFLGACSNPFSAPSPLAGDPEAAGTLVELSLSASTGPARIVLPELPALSEIASYRLFGGREGGPRESLGSWTELSGASLSLQTGSWDFVLDAYDEGGQLLLEGELLDKDISAPASLAFVLRGVESGEGSIEITLLWPDSGNLVNSVELSLDGGPALSFPPQAAPPSSLTVSYSKHDIPSGDYLLSIAFLDSYGERVATRSEWVLVRKGLTSVAEIQLGAADFNYRPAKPSNLTLTKGALDWESQKIELAWVDNSDNEEGFSLEYSLDAGISWTSLVRLPAGTTSYEAELPRGALGVFALRSFNALGASSAISDGIRTQAQLYISGESEEFETVQLRLWDPASLALRGSAEFKYTNGAWSGGIEPQLTSSLLLQAYAYDAAGKIRAVAEATKAIASPGDAISLAFQPARLMGGNVQKTCFDPSASLTWISEADLGFEASAAVGATSDGLNLYIARYHWGIMRRVISSGATSWLAGSIGGFGVGIDEDNPGQNPIYTYITDLTTDGRQLYLAHGQRDISRISFTGSSKRIFSLGSEERMIEYLSTDGTYLYLNNVMNHRLELASGLRTTLDATDWSWKASGAVYFYLSGDLTTDGTSLFIADFQTSKVKSLPLGGGAPTEICSRGYGGGMTTDGSRLYYLDQRSESSYLVDYLQIDIATKAKTVVGTFGEAETWGLVGRAIATDGKTIFGFKK